MLSTEGHCSYLQVLASAHGASVNSCVLALIPQVLFSCAERHHCGACAHLFSFTSWLRGALTQNTGIDTPYQLHFALLWAKYHWIVQTGLKFMVILLPHLYATLCLAYHAS